MRPQWLISGDTLQFFLFDISYTFPINRTSFRLRKCLNVLISNDSQLDAANVTSWLASSITEHLLNAEGTYCFDYLVIIAVNDGKQPVILAVTC